MDNYEKRLHNSLLSFHQQLFDEKKNIRKEFSEKTNCPVCHTDKSHLLFEKDFFHYHRCDNCSMVYMNPRLNDEATKSFYNSEVNRVYNERKFDAVSTSTALDNSRNTENVRVLKEFLKRRNPIGLKLLEIGCAKGVFLKEAKKNGFEVHGLELNRENCEFANQLVGGNVHGKDLLTMNYPSASFDVVYMRDVIEHIHNPSPFLAEISRILRPGGAIFLETHNIDGWVFRLLGARHTVIFGFEHPVHWSPSTLSLALEKHGMKTKQVNLNSADFTIRSFARYFLKPTYTTIFPAERKNKIAHFLIKVIFFLFSRPPLRQLDESLLPRLANGAGAGSTMKLLAVKE